jgi:hypothetical protein
MQRRLVVVLAVLAMAALVASSKAEASVTWPARCTTFKCVNAHLNVLHSQTAALKTKVAQLTALDNCFIIVGVTQFPDYLENDGVTSITGLDYTLTGNAPDFWSLGINTGDCGTPTTASGIKTTARVSGASVTVLPGFAQRR